jgi:hypothetical protein
MQIRTFYYISEAKVAMLEAQLARRRFLSLSFTPKMEVAGLSVAAELKGTPAEHLAARTAALVERMRKKKLLRPLNDAAELQTAGFYRDHAEWFNGLYAFKGRDGPDQRAVRVVSYLLWRRWKDALILLAGSPVHVLGERVVRDGVWAYGTTGTWAGMLNFVRNNLAPDEPDPAGVEEGSPAPEDAGGFLPWTEWDAAAPDDGNPTLSFEPAEYPDGLALAVFCARHLTRLPREPAETAFTVVRRLDLNPGADPLRWSREVRRVLPGGGPLTLNGLTTVYVGSPIYTARG